MIVVEVMIAVESVVVSVDEPIMIGCSRRERNTAQHFAKARGPNCRKALACRKAGCCEAIADHDQLVRISTLVAVAAHGRGDGPDRRGAVAIDPTHDVAKAIG